MSLPVRGAWVEISGKFGLGAEQQSLPVRGAWVEIFRGGACASPSVGSLPVRGAWVEIASCARIESRSAVAPRAGSVG